jgi:hypothetical protein
MDNLNGMRRWAPARIHSIAYALAGAASALLISACGGGGEAASTQQPVSPPSPAVAPSSSPPPATPSCAPVEGSAPETSGAFAVGGTIAGRSDPSFIMLPVPTPFAPAYGRYRRILVYGPDLAASSALSGFVDAGDTYWCHESKAYNGYDYGVDDGGTSNSYVYLHTMVDSPSSTVSGSIRSTTASNELDGTSLPGAAAGYAFNRPASIADITGDWKLNSTGGVGFDAHVGADGQMTVTGSGSGFSTRLTPSPAGVNLFNFGDGYPLGVGMAYPLASGEHQLLLIWYQAGPMEDVLGVAIGRR